MSNRLMVLTVLGVAPFCFAPMALSMGKMPTDPPERLYEWKRPPTEKPKNRTCRLVNYCHMSNELNYPKPELEGMLAQWDVLILFHHNHVMVQKLVSLENIRKINPNIKILAWMPLQGPAGRAWTRSIPEGQLDGWTARDTRREIVMAPWNQPLMNPVADNYGWPRYVISYLEKYCLGRPDHLYDGVMLDCLWPVPHFGIDAIPDGRIDGFDQIAWRDAYVFMLRELRKKYPDIILTGNAGGPLPQGEPLLDFLNGSMHENALGNQWGENRALWPFLWNGYQASLQASNRGQRKPMHFIAADVRMNRSIDQARKLKSLTADDLRRMRLGLCTSLLMDGGYFGFDRGDCLHGQLWWFDEYEADIGSPVKDFEKDLYGPGIYSRQFEQGLVVVNTSERPRRVRLDTEHVDWSTQEESRQHEIPPLDGRLLKRKP